MTLSKRITWFTALLMAAALMLTLVPPDAARATNGERTYRVSITNLTSGQPMTPYVVATHSFRAGIFRPWRSASPGLQALAENGGVDVLKAELEANPRFGDVQVAGTPPVVPGATVSVDVVSTPGSRFISLAGMLICTNDGFGGISRKWLDPHRTRTFYAYAWDAGTERNTEAYTDLVPPCDGSGQTGVSNPALAENGRVHLHRGIKGIADLVPSVHGWQGPVVKIVIEPLD
ncbi:MAG: spondin domain-containing protein [Acidimicrobiia bacterium]